MSINFNIFQPLPQGGFAFNVLGACTAEKVNLSKACTIQFVNNNGTDEFLSIGGVTKGGLQAEPGIVGLGVWLGTTYTFFIIAVALCVVVYELNKRWITKRVQKRDSRGRIYTTHRFLAFIDPDDTRSKFRKLIRALVLGAADTQIVLVIAQILNFSTKGKCSLSAYHFRAAVDAMFISFTSIVLSVATVRSYWRSKPAAGIRFLLSTGIFICVSLVLFSGMGYATDWPPPSNTNDSLILLPVACLMEADLWAEVQSQVDNQPHSAVNNPSRFPVGVVFIVILGVAFFGAHTATVIRRIRGRHGEGNTIITIYLNKWHGILTTIYWLVVCFLPSAIALWCWTEIGFARSWVNDSGWLGSPNPEDTVWETGQLVPLLLGVLILISACDQIWERTGERAEEGVEMMNCRYEVSRHII